MVTSYLISAAIYIKILKYARRHFELEMAKIGDVIDEAIRIRDHLRLLADD